MSLHTIDALALLSNNILIVHTLDFYSHLKFLDYFENLLKFYRVDLEVKLHRKYITGDK